MMKWTVTLMFVIVLFLSGCGASLGVEKGNSGTSGLPMGSPSDLSTEPAPGPSSQPAQSNSPSVQTMSIAVYYFKNSPDGIYLIREVHMLEKSEGAARAALNELISGTPLTEGAYKVLPEDTKILGVKIEDGLATIDFSKEVLKANVGSEGEALGISSIVDTLTEFPTIHKVQFTIEGSAENGMDWWGHVGLYNQPFSRDLSKVYEPAIWVTMPADGSKITSPLTLCGNARVFEAAVSYRLKDYSGNILAQGLTMATAGAPTRGGFEATIAFTPSPSGKGNLEVFEVSMKDGTEINKVTIPVTW